METYTGRGELMASLDRSVLVSSISYKNQIEHILYTYAIDYCATVQQRTARPSHQRRGDQRAERRDWKRRRGAPVGEERGPDGDALHPDVPGRVDGRERRRSGSVGRALAVDEARLRGVSREHRERDRYRRSPRVGGDEGPRDAPGHQQHRARHRSSRTFKYRRSKLPPMTPTRDRSEVERP